MNPFEPGTFGARYFDSLAGMSRENLERRMVQLDRQMTYAVDDECRRMVCVQAVQARLGQ